MATNIEKELNKVKKENESLNEVVERLQIKNAILEDENNFLKGQELDFSKPHETGQKIFNSLCKSSITNAVHILKQLNLNYFKKLTETVKNQENTFNYNKRQLEVLKKASENVADDEVWLEPKS